MDSSMYIWILIFVVLYLTWNTERQAIHHIQKKKSKKETAYMLELAQKFIGEDCVIYFLGGSSVTGIIREVSSNGNGVLVERENDTELINLEFVTRIRKYPLNKKGKKKSVILD